MKDKFFKLLSNELKLTRISRGLTLEETSEKCGIATSTISSYENGTRLMYVNKIVDLLEAYDEEPCIFFSKVIAKMQ